MKDVWFEKQNVMKLFFNVSKCVKNSFLINKVKKLQSKLFKFQCYLIFFTGCRNNMSLVRDIRLELKSHFYSIVKL